jgi:hypothetical protein
MEGVAEIVIDADRAAGAKAGIGIAGIAGFGRYPILGDRPGCPAL